MFADLLIPHWFWLSLGVILLAFEMLGASGYLLWSGIAALIVGLLTYFIPLDWPKQPLLFALLTVVSAILWWYWLKQRQQHQQPNLLNQRMEQLIGTHTTLLEDTVDGISRVRIADSTWRVASENELPKGTAVTVIAIQGITLQVKPMQPNFSRD